VSYPWLHDNETTGARAGHEAGDNPGEDGRLCQHKLEAPLEADPEFRAWADQKYPGQRRTRRPAAGPEAAA
jgi:hypothetical protein